MLTKRLNDYHLAYILRFAPLSKVGEKFQSETRFVNLTDIPDVDFQTPQFVKLPLANYAPHPWHESLYTIRMYDFAIEEQPETSNFKVIHFEPKSTKIVM